jgi:hypothetical protein
MLPLRLLPLLLLGCSAARYSSDPGAPTLVLPARFAEGSPEVQPAPSASAPTAAPTPAAGSPVPSKAPDPKPLELAAQVEYELELAGGKISVVSVRPVQLPKPQVTPRRLGRFALELSIGSELVERLRFDFPGTAADEPTPGPKRLSTPLDLSSRAIARVKLLVPHSPRVRRALLVDRALDRAEELPWPLPAAPPSPSTEAPPVPSRP